MKPSSSRAVKASRRFIERVAIEQPRRQSHGDHARRCRDDCGVMINPHIVHGMTYGGIAHGIGAALYEKFAYSDDGQLLSGSLMEYLIPSAMEIPPIHIVDHCTPSPLTTFGQKGSGEAGYLGAPAAVANAVNDALAPLQISVETLPMTQDALWRTIAAVQTQGAIIKYSIKTNTYI